MVTFQPASARIHAAVEPQGPLPMTIALPATAPPSGEHRNDVFELGGDALHHPVEHDRIGAIGVADLSRAPSDGLGVASELAVLASDRWRHGVAAGFGQR